MRDLIDVLWSTTTLALRGALLQNPWGTLLRVAAASIVGALVGIVAIVAGGPLWLATLVGGLIGGALSPYLLRNIKIA